MPTLESTTFEPAALDGVAIPTTRAAQDATTLSGHTPTLIAAFLHFDLSFMLWVLIGALGIFIADSVGLTAAQKGLIVALPILSGSLLRVPIGWLSDRVGARRVGALLLASLYLPLSIGWLAADSLGMLLLTGLLLGAAGASFAVALPLASRWYPPERQGLAMGVAAAGNSGTVLTNLIAPQLALLFGWQAVLGAAMLPLTIVLALFLLLAREPQARAAGPATAARPAHPVRAALARRELWWFCLFYSVTFGGYVGLTSFLPLLLHDQYGLATLDAGRATALVALIGSLSRPLGGYLADRLGGTRMLLGALSGVGLVYLLAAGRPSLGLMLAALAVGMACFGLGNGAVFQLVPQRFREEIGAMTGLVGMAGGIGGFYLASSLGFARQATGSYQSGFLIFAALALAALAALTCVKRRWRTRWELAAEGVRI